MYSETLSRKVDGGATSKALLVSSDKSLMRILMEGLGVPTFGYGSKMFSVYWKAFGSLGSPYNV